MAVVEGIRCCKKVGSEWQKRHASMWSGCNEDECTIMSRNFCSQIKNASKCASSGSMLQETEREESDEVQEAGDMHEQTGKSEFQQHGELAKIDAQLSDMHVQTENVEDQQESEKTADETAR